MHWMYELFVGDDATLPCKSGWWANLVGTIGNWYEDVSVYEVLDSALFVVPQFALT